MKKKTKNKQTNKIEIGSWVSPITQAKYWADKIGEVVGTVSKTTKLVTVRFRYRRDGTQLEKIEEFGFAAKSLKVVGDFRARVAKHAPKPKQAKDDDLFSCFDVSEEVESVPEVKTNPKRNFTLIKVFCEDGPWAGNLMTTTSTAVRIAAHPGEYHRTDSVTEAGQPIFRYSGPALPEKSILEQFN